MKTLCRKITLAILPIIAIAVVLWFQACSRHQLGTDNRDKKFMLVIGDRNNNHWVDVNQTALDTALKNLPKDAQWNISFLCKDNANPQDHYNPFNPQEVCIQTDKVKKFEGADSAAVGASAANDPNATQHIRVNRAQDLQGVLAAFLPTVTPTPTP